MALLDAVLHFAADTIAFFVERLWMIVEVGDDEAGVGFGDDASSS